MYVWELVRVLVRRWYVTVVGLLLVPLGCLYVMDTVPTQYQSNGQLMLLLPPQATGEKTPSNPYLNLPAGLTTTASLIASESMGKDVSARLTEGRRTAEFSVALVAGAGPLLTVTTTDVEPAEAVALRDRVTAWLQQRLVEIQEAVDVPDNQLMRADSVNLGLEAEPMRGDTLRAMAGTAGAGLVLTVLVAVVLDRLLRRRQELRGPTSAPAAAAAGPDPGPVAEDPDEAEHVASDEESEESEESERPTQLPVLLRVSGDGLTATPMWHERRAPASRENQASPSVNGRERSRQRSRQRR